MNNLTLNEVRLNRSIKQANLAGRVGFSRSTLTRLVDGRSFSVDLFVRATIASGLTDHPKTLLSGGHLSEEFGCTKFDTCRGHRKRGEVSRTKNFYAFSLFC